MEKDGKEGKAKFCVKLRGKRKNECQLSRMKFSFPKCIDVPLA